MIVQILPIGTTCKIAGGPVGTITGFACWGKGSLTYELTYIDEQSVARSDTFSATVIVPVGTIPAGSLYKLDIPDASSPQSAAAKS